MIGSKLLALLLAPLLMARSNKPARPKKAKAKKNIHKAFRAKAKAPKLAHKVAAKVIRGAPAYNQKKQVGRTPPFPPPQPKPKIEVVLPFEKKVKLVSPAIAPKAISPTNGLRIAAFTPRFGWLSVALGARYQVMWGSEANLTNSRSLIVNETAATLPPDHALAPGKMFYWRVRAGNESGWGPWSPIQEFGTPEELEEPDE